MIKNDTWCNEKMDKGDAPSGENLKNHDTNNETFQNGNIIKNDTSSSEKIDKIMLSLRST